MMLLMVSYSALTLLGDAESNLIPQNLLAVLIFSRAIASFELFLPLALYVTLLMGLGKLYSNHEVVAMHASGVSIFGLIKSLLPLILIVTILTAIVALFVRPWSYDLRYGAKHEAEQMYDFERLEKGYFYANEDSGQVYFVHDVARNGKVKKDIFVYQPSEDYAQVIYADMATHQKDLPGAAPTINFSEGTLFRSADEGVDTLVRFKEFTVISKVSEIIEREFKVKAASNRYLSKSSEPDEVAEFQWRTSSAFKAFFLSIIAILLAKTSARQGSYGKVVIGILIFFVVHAVSLVTETGIENGAISAYPGLWMIVFALMVISAILAKRYS
ncbi:MAG: LptF/LptG family permease [Bacteroidota bacterium]